jgi:hypothetical protein
MQVSVLLARMEQLLPDGPRILAAFDMTFGKLIMERSVVGQTFKMLVLLAGVGERIKELTWRLARNTRSIRKGRE